MNLDNFTNEIERRRKMFHWFIDGLGLHGFSWENYDYLTPDWVSEHYNVNF